MSDFVIREEPVELLPPYWREIALALDPKAVSVYVVYAGGEIFGVYLSLPEATAALELIKAEFAAGRTPKQQTKEQAISQRLLKQAERKEHSSGTGLKS